MDIPMRSLPLDVFALLAVLVLVYGCNEPFSPKGPFVQRIVAYSVLSPRSDTQYVRVYTNYNPPGFDPSVVKTTTYDTSASVVISSPSQSFSFHDTLLSPTLRAFVMSPLRPIPGTAYTLTVVSSRFGNVSATTKMPGPGSLSVADHNLLLYPYGKDDKYIEVDGFLGSDTRGYLIRFYVDFSLKSDSTFEGEEEVPSSYEIDSQGLTIPVYPLMRRVVDSKAIVYYSVANYLQVLYDLGLRYPTGIKLKWAKFQLFQFDEAVYNYYKVVNGFEDKYSIRTDQPDYTNIQNGLGVFGSYSIDSTIVRY
jgi:hypothetical protein